MSCFAISKIPQGKILSNGVLKENPQYQVEQQYVKVVEETTRNPLSVGKHRSRAK
jgi:hypothetical protein